RECAVGRAIRDRVGDALLAVRDRSSRVLVEHSHILHERWCDRAHHVYDLLGLEITVDYDREVAEDCRKTRKLPKNNAARTVLNDSDHVKLAYPDVALETARSGDVGMQRARDAAEHAADGDPCRLSRVQIWRLALERLPAHRRQAQPVERQLKRALQIGEARRP